MRRLGIMAVGLALVVGAVAVFPALSTASPQITQIIDSSGDGAGHGLTGPHGIAADGSGNVYVAGFLSNNAFKITSGDVITQIIDSSGDKAGHTLGKPYGIAADASGNVYVAGYRSNNAFKITSGGVITQIIDSSGDGAGHGLTGPNGIAVDGSGNVYVAAILGDNAFKIAAPLAVGGIAELPPLATTGGSGMGGATCAVVAGAAAGVLAIAVLATLTVKRRGVR